MRDEPTLRERIASLKDEGEITGFTGQMLQDGRLTDEVKNLLEIRRAEIRKAKGWK